MRNILFAIFMTIMLSACGTQTPLVKETVVRYEQIPQHLVEPIRPDAPMKKEQYALLKPHEKETYLADYIVSLLGIIKEQNIKLEKIHKLNSELK